MKRKSLFYALILAMALFLPNSASAGRYSNYCIGTVCTVIDWGKPPPNAWWIGPWPPESPPQWLGPWMPPYYPRPPWWIGSWPPPEMLLWHGPWPYSPPPEWHAGEVYSQFLSMYKTLWASAPDDWIGIWPPQPPYGYYGWWLPPMYSGYWSQPFPDRLNGRRYWQPLPPPPIIFPRMFLR